MQPVRYLHFGYQCPFHPCMQQEAGRFAQELGRSLETVDLERAPHWGRQLGLFFPGTVLVDDLHLCYPGTASQWLESYRRRGPLEGSYAYPWRQPETPDAVLPLTPARARDMAGLCQAGGAATAAKARWLARALQPPHRLWGLLAYADARAVAGVECLPETQVPYAVPLPREDSAWLACLYGGEAYRQALLQRLAVVAAQAGFTRLRAAVGQATPFPNGPWPLFEEQGFVITRTLGPFFIRHRWDQLYLVEKRLLPPQAALPRPGCIGSSHRG